MKKILLPIISFTLLFFSLQLIVSADDSMNGVCGADGDNLTWILDSEGILTISGTGKMGDYGTYMKKTPWNKYTESLKTVIIQNGVTYIGVSAFKNCSNIEKIIISGTVENISSDAFYGCTNLREISVNNDNPYYSSIENVLYTKNNQILILYPCAKENSEYTVLPETVRIKNNAFSENTYIEKIILNENLAAIENSAFENCENLTYLEWNAKNISVSNYGDSVFKNAGSKIYGFKVVITENVEKLPTKTFSESNISKFVLNAEINSVPAYAFHECQMLKEIELPDSIETLGDYAFYDCDGLTSFICKEGLQKIGNNAFYDCNSLKNITFCNSVNQIGSSAFAYCTSIEKLKLPDNDVKINSYAFYYCTGLIEIEIPSDIKTLGLSIFSGSTSLKKLIFIAPSYDLTSTRISNESNFTVYAHSGGNIELFAKENAFPFEEIHTYSEEIVITAPNCTEAGEKFNKCKYCDKRLNTEKTPATGHTYTTAITAPTCTEKGFTTYICDCGLSFRDDYINPTGHTYKKEVIPPTCTEKGYTIYSCVCGFSDRLDYVLPTGHTYSKDVVAPTCTEKGYTIYSCVCGFSDRLDYVLATGHTPGEWEVVTPAQVGAEGREHQKCVVCDTVINNRTIPAIPVPTHKTGDANGDGKITAADARITLRISAKLEKIEDYNLPLAVFDATGDGKLTAADARKILRASAKLETL